jgi:hypothetical protein
LLLQNISLENGGLETFVWTPSKPWIPGPMLSIHVRIGDKGKEMRLYPFKVYMELAKRVRKNFPQVYQVWLSSEMQVELSRYLKNFNDMLLTYIIFFCIINNNKIMVFEK